LDKYKIEPFDFGEISIYIHWPFCTKKCPYCDFNSYVSNNIDYKGWLVGFFQSIENQKKFFAGKKIKSIFFGGGTPSLMDPDAVFQLINYFKKHNKDNGFGEISEITLESNPSTFEIKRFKDFKKAGVNRLSTGIQSFKDSSLKFLGRNHSSVEAIKALEKSNEIFERTSFDLIIGLPNQTLEDWKLELDFALQFFKEHISIYQLTIEEGTPFFRWGIQEAKEKIGEELYMYTLEKLESKNIFQYEISNFATKGAESIHNMNYWKGGEYIGIGPNAHGRVFFNNAWFATKEYKNPNIWLQQSQAQQKKSIGSELNPIFDEFTEIKNEERFEELVLTSLRVNSTIDPKIINLLDANKINILIEQGLLSKNRNEIISTTKGRLCLNYMIQFLLA
jgi:putative oxygen-independent coproporphyrinogen III oxidase